MTNFFGYSELLCEECGEVLVTNFMTIFPGEDRQEKFTTEKSTTYLAPQKLQISLPCTSGTAVAQGLAIPFSTIGVVERLGH